MSFCLLIINYSTKAVERTKRLQLNILAAAFIFAAVMALFSASAFAASVPKAKGQIKSYDGAILRESASTGSEMLDVLPDNTGITIHKEVFRSKTSTAKKYKWYYVTANGIKGYVRSDLVDGIRYGSVRGETKDETGYRKGAGTEMAPAGSLGKGTKVTIVRNCSYTGTPIISGVSNPVFGEISGAGQPAPLTSPWGLSMDYILENNTYKE